MITNLCLNEFRKRDFPRRVSRRGFTLVEVLISALIAGIALVAIMDAMIDGFQVIRRSRETSAAVKILDEEMERLRTEPYAIIGALTGNTTKNMWPENPASDKTCTLSYDVSACALDAVTTTWVTQVTLTVTWYPTGKPETPTYLRTMSITGYFCNGGLNYM